MSEKLEIAKLDVNDMIITKADVQFDDTKLLSFATYISESISSQEFTEDSIAEHKKYIANARKAVKAVADKRKELVTIASGNINETIEKMKQVEKQITQAVATLDVKIKDYEQSVKDKKKSDIELIFISDNKYDFLTFNDVFHEKMLNKTYSLNDCCKDIEQVLERTRTDIAVIEAMPNKEDIIIEYKLTRDLAHSLAKVERVNAMKQQESEKKAKAEQEKDIEVTFVDLDLEEEDNSDVMNGYEMNEKLREIDKKILAYDAEIQRLTDLRNDVVAERDFLFEKMEKAIETAIIKREGFEFK